MEEDKPIEQPIIQQPKPEPKIQKKPKKEKGPGLISKLKGRLLRYRRVIEVSRKPDKTEFMASSKITGMGLLIVGSIGFVIFIIYHLVV